MTDTMSPGVFVAAVEGGGTTFVASVAQVLPKDGSTDHDDGDIVSIGPDRLRIVKTASFPPSSKLTWTPDRILTAVSNFLKKNRPDSGSYAAVGVATFGPAGVDPLRSSTYGTVLGGSPKKEWRNVDVLSPVLEACGIEREGGAYAFETDVNAPAYAEFVHRSHRLQVQEEEHGQPQEPTDKERDSIAGKRPTSCAYITVGTGVGVGLVINSKPVHGLLHPEGGHVAVRVLPGEDDPAWGYSWGAEKSPYGGRGTVEGIASSVALTERWMQTEQKDGGDSSDNGNNVADAKARDVLATLPDSHPVWDHAANALANLCTSLILLTSIETIVLGGGVMKRSILYGMVRKRTWELLNGYLDGLPEFENESKMDDLIVQSSWGDRGGLVGALVLALDARREVEEVGDGALEKKAEPVPEPEPEPEPEVPDWATEGGYWDM